MKSVFLLQVQRFIRAPYLVLIFFGLTLLFVFFIAGAFPSGDNQMTVYTYADPSLSIEEQEAWLKKLNESDVFHFDVVSEAEARRALVNGETYLALQLLEQDYRLLVTVDDHDRSIVESYVNQVYAEELRIREMEELGVDSDFRSNVELSMAEPVLTVKSSSLGETNASSKYDERLQVLFGMTLFFSLFTMLFSLLDVAEGKKNGTWSRLIVSPLHKWQIYMGHLLYCFVIGFAQILTVFLFFHYVLGFDLGNRFGSILVVIFCYTFAIVSLGILMIGLVNSSQQLQAVIPIVANAVAMLGGAFWPIEVVTNDILLALSKGSPIYYGIEALKGITMFNHGVIDIAGPLSIMLLFGVVCMGIGLNVMERRA